MRSSARNPEDAPRTVSIAEEWLVSGGTEVLGNSPWTEGDVFWRHQRFVFRSTCRRGTQDRADRPWRSAKKRAETGLLPDCSAASLLTASERTLTFLVLMLMEIGPNAFFAAAPRCGCGRSVVGRQETVEIAPTTREIHIRTSGQSRGQASVGELELQGEQGAIAIPSGCCREPKQHSVHCNTPADAAPDVTSREGRTICPPM